MDTLLSTQFDPSALAYLGGIAASVLYSFVKRNSWGKGVNLGAMVGLSILIGVADAALRGQLAATDVLGSAVAALGAAQSFYNLNFLVSKAEGRVTTKDLPVNTTP